MKVETKIIKLDEIHLNPDNPRQITEKNMERLVKSLQEFPEMLNIREIVVDETMTVLGGNMRLLALQKSGAKEAAAKIVSGLTADQKREFVIKDNAAFGEWDFDALANAWDDLPLVDWGLDLPKAWLQAQEQEEDILSTKDENLDGFGAVHTLKNEADFGGVGLYDFPEIRSDMILNINNLSTWAGPNATKSAPPYLYNYATDSTINLPWDQTVVSFYTGDNRFEKLWEKPSEPIKRMLNKKILGCFTPNFSTYFAWPKALRIYNIYRSRWVGRYFQEAGISIVPDLSCAVGDLDCVLDGIPHNSPVAIQVHRKYKLKEIEEKNKILKYCIETLNPSVLWIYGDKDRLDMFPVLKSVNTKLLVPRTILQAEQRKEKGGE